MAYATPDPSIRESVAVCNPNAPTQCLAPDVNGALPTTGGSGGGGTTQPVSETDGANVTLGAKADAANAATGSSLMAIERQLHADLIAPTPAGAAIIGKVTTDQTTHGTTDKVAADLYVGGAANSNANPAYVAILSGAVGQYQPSFQTAGAAANTYLQTDSHSQLKTVETGSDNPACRHRTCRRRLGRVIVHR